MREPLRSLRRAHRTGARAITLGLLLALAGCAGLPTQSFLAPSAARQTYDGFMAYAAFSDLAAQGAFERAMCRRLENAGHACQTMVAAAPPTAPQDAASRQRAAAHSGAQAVLLIELADPKPASRRILANGRPGYRVSLIDIVSQRVMARIAVEGTEKTQALKARGAALAATVVTTLDRRHMLVRRD